MSNKINDYKEKKIVLISKHGPIIPFGDIDQNIKICFLSVSPNTIKDNPE